MLLRSLSSSEEVLAAKKTNDGQTLGASGEPGGDNITCVRGVF